MKLVAIMAGVLLAAAAAARADAQGAPAASEVQRLLQGAANPAEFADLSSGGLIMLQHRPSGLVCTFGSDPKGNSLNASAAGVICNTQGETEIDTLEAFHAAPTSEEELQGALGRAMGQFSGAQPVSGFADTPSDRPKAPPHTSRRFVAATRNGDQLFVRIAYAQVGEWFVLQRVISTTASAKLADADGERRLLAAIGQVMDRPAPGAGK